MNSLELRIVSEYKFEKTENWLALSIDGKSIFDNSNATVFEELENSLNKQGDYLIFTCACGVADCAGWEKVKVKHQDGKVIWEFNYDIDFLFEFDLNAYRSEIEKIRLEMIKNNIELKPEFIVNPEH